MAGTKGATFKNSILLHVLENADIATIGDATGLRGSTAAGSLYLALHTGDPVAGDQTTNEATYTGYSRVAIGRTAGAWTTANGATENTAVIQFAECTAGSDTITHWSLGVATSGASLILYTGTVSLAVIVGTIPQVAAGDLDITES